MDNQALDYALDKILLELMEPAVKPYPGQRTKRRAEAIKQLKLLIQDERRDELTKACYNWSQYPDLPATYMINRQAEITKDAL